MNNSSLVTRSGGSFSRSAALGCIGFMGLALAACTGGVSSTSSTTGQSQAQAVPTYTVSGSVSGLNGSGLVLQDNNGDSLPVTASGAFTFSTALISGNSYNISVLNQPQGPNQTCTVANGMGTVGDSDISDISITCADKAAATDAISAMVSGLAGTGLVLQNDGADNLAISADGIATFATRLPGGTAYSITVLTPPEGPAQDCTVVNGSGTTGDSDVNNVQVTCRTNANPTHVIGGTISGIAATGPIVLQDNGTDNLTLTTDGTFAFTSPVPQGSAYSVTALASDSVTRTCAFTHATGVVDKDDVSDVQIVCAGTAPLVTVMVNVAGLQGGQLVLQNNGGDSLTVSANGIASFATQVEGGAPYDVSVLSQPGDEVCTVTAGQGTVAVEMRPIAVNCSTRSFTVSANVSGLLEGSQVVLNDNGGDTLTVSANGVSTFAGPVAFNGAYAVSIVTQPAGETCTVVNGSGSGVVANVTVTVACAVQTFTISANVTGLSQGTQVTLNDNGNDPLTVSAVGTWAFGMQVAYGGGYNVTVTTQPTGATCSVGLGSGAGVTGPVTVNVTCAGTSFPISARVTGLQPGQQVTLNDNGSDPLLFTADATQQFATRIAYGGNYSVTVATQPANEVCSVANGTGAGITATPAAVTVTCSTSPHAVSVTVSGLSQGQQVTLYNNGADALTVTPAAGTTAGTGTFATQVADGGAYAVTVATQPTGETCTVNNGSGTNLHAAVTVTVTCATTTSTISAAVSGLAAGQQVTLYDNAADSLTITNNGVTPFGTKIAYGGSYVVTIATQPTVQVCSITGTSSGTNVTADATVSIVCTTPAPNTVSVNVSGLTAGQQVVFLDNGGDALTVTTDGTRAFATPVPAGGSYGVTVGTQPTQETCAVTNGSGTNLAAPVTVTATCTPAQTYTVSIVVSGVATGYAFTLNDNGADPLNLTANGTHTFARQIADGQAYNVTVATQPPRQSCTVTNGSGTIQGAAVTATVTCTGIVGGFVSGLTGSGMILSNLSNGVTGLLDIPPAYTATGYFFYVTPGNTYDINVSRQPLGFTQGCSVANNSGTLGNSSVLNAGLTCINVTPYVLTLAGAASHQGRPSAAIRDSQGDYFWVDVNNNEVWEADTTGAQFVIAGSPTAGFTDGNAGAAQFNLPTGLAMFNDQAGHQVLLVTDFANHAIRTVSILQDAVGLPVTSADGRYVWTVTTVLGTGRPGSSNTTGRTASFYAPSGIVESISSQPDPNFRTFIVADTFNNLIRIARYNNGVWSAETLAGSGAQGVADGDYTTASFYHPMAVSTIAGDTGTIFVADSANNEIRVIHDSGGELPVQTVTTLAGSTSRGSSNAQGSAASFSDPSGIAAVLVSSCTGPQCSAVFRTYNVYVADTGNNQVRLVTVDPANVAVANSGNVTQPYGSRTGEPGLADGSPGALNVPWGLSFAAGSLLIADGGNSAIRAAAAGTLSTVVQNVGGYADGPSGTSLFRHPQAVVADDVGGVYVADTGNHVIRYLINETVSTVAGTGQAGTADGGGPTAGVPPASFTSPAGIARDSQGTLYVTSNNAVRKITAAGVVSTLAGGTAGNADGTGVAAQFNAPQGIAVDGGGNLYVADSANNAIRKVTPAGVVTTLAGSATAGNTDATGAAASFSAPGALAIDLVNSRLFVADYGNSSIRVIALGTGAVTTLATSAPVNHPSGIAVDLVGNVYVSDQTQRIFEYDLNGNFTTLAGSSGDGGTGNGIASEAQFLGPAGLAADASGNLFVADAQNNEIREISPYTAIPQ